MGRIILICLVVISAGIKAQEPMRVERCTAISPDAPVYNIHIDEDDNKWITNSEGLWQVHAADLATPKEVSSEEMSLLMVPNGNRDIRWPKGAISGLLNGAIADDDDITCGYYNAIQDHLWVGTGDAGLFLFRTEPKLKWVKEVNRRMPKLRSNTINTIYVDGDEDRHFFGTDEGILVGRGGRWGLEERFFRFQAITYRGKDVWLLAEDLIWIVNEKDDWRSIELDPENIQGQIKDIAFDRDGRLWIASEYLTMYDVENERYRIFDGADYFTSSDVNCLAVDRTGAVWVGTEDKGLYLIEKESAMTVTCLVENELSCVPGEDNGALVVKINGGQPPYQYKWDEGLEGDNPKDLGPGKYVVTVTDSRGQSKAAEGTIVDTRLHLSIEALSPATPDGSSKGSALATLEGGTPKFTYQWDNGERGPRAENLGAGMHNLTVTDANGCKAEGQVDISQDIADLSVNISKTSESKCAGDGANAALVVAKGGVPPYKYTWTENVAVDAEAKGLPAGLHYVTVTDDQGTSTTTSVSFDEVATLEVMVTANATASSGNDNGRAAVEASGGTGRYAYAWDNGESGSQAKKLAAGTHQVTVTDANGCAVVGQVEISEEIADLTASISKTGQSKCAGDGANTAEVVVRGGVPPFDYQWTNNLASGAEAKALPAGLHYVTVTDAQGETVITSIRFDAVDALEIKATANAAASTGGSDGRASVQGTGGTGRYSYAWGNGEKTKSVTNLSPGTHTVTVTDESGCSAQTSVEIEENISELRLLLTTSSEIKCKGNATGSVLAEVSGGKGPYQYTWSDNNLTGTSLTNLKAGEYALTVVDAVGNEAVASVGFDEPDSLTVAVIEQRGVTDEASSDGKAQLQVNGGKGPYSYLWDNQSTSEKAENLSIGAHSVTITDANGCQASASFETQKKILPQLSLANLRAGQVVEMQMLQFDADSTNINESAKPILDEVYQFLKDNPAVVIRVEGHTNNIPPDDFCDRLSTDRAKSVAVYIVQQGIADERVYYKGWGKRKPVYSNRTPEGRRKNQRVEINILKVRPDDG